MFHRRVLIGGNWKCNGTKTKVQDLVGILSKAELPANTDVVVAPTALHVSYVLENGRKDIQVAVQNVWHEPKQGAWTGELTVDLVKDLGVNWTILGHSERRKYNGETPGMVGAKVKTALAGGLNVIACVGETLEEREAGRTMDVVVEQMVPIVAAIASPEEWTKVVIAYEPVWAIGTGKTATSEQAQEVHADLRAWLAGKVGEKIASAVRIIYGGSVSAKNCNELMGNKDIDGFLVGGASLNADFLTIIASGSIKSKI